MYKIGFDLLGNDLGIEPILEGIKRFMNENDNYHFRLFGPQETILKVFPNSSQISIVNNQNLVTMENTSLRNVAKSQSSMSLAFQALKNGELDALLSCGDSGLYLANSVLTLKRLEGISRPAFMPLFPSITKNKKFLVLDVGANLETSSEMLFQWAFLAQAFAQKVLKISEPRIGLITIGTEAYKGHTWQKEADQKLAQNFPNYLGFIEPNRLMYDIVDVALVDGYGGNLILKAKEGAILAFKDLLKKSIKKTLWRKLLALFLKPAFKEAGEIFDHRNVGAAFVVGLEALVLKLHGKSNAQAIYSGIQQMQLALENDLIKHFQESLKNVNNNKGR